MANRCFYDNKWDDGFKDDYGLNGSVPIMQRENEDV
jgi:hypothetical protein